MGTKTMLTRGGVLLLAGLFIAGCGDKGGDAKKDDAKAEKDDGDEKKKKKKDDAEDDKDAKKDKKAKKAAGVFTKRAIAMGDKRTETFTMAMSFEIEAAGQKKAVRQGQTREKIEEVLAVKDERPTKIKVTFSKMNKSMQEDGPPQTKAEPIEGKTYIVEDKDGEVVVTTEDGGKPPLPEVTAVKKAYAKDFSSKNKDKTKAFKEALLGAKLETGKRVPEIEKVFTDFFGAGMGTGDAPNLAEVKLTYKGTEGDHAIFDIEFTMKLEEGPMKMNIPLKGEMKVVREGPQMGGVSMKGPISIDATGSPIPIKGKGQLTMDQKSVYELKK